jgi:hypothetical protein
MVCPNCGSAGRELFDADGALNARNRGDVYRKEVLRRQPNYRDELPRTQLRDNGLIFSGNVLYPPLIAGRYDDGRAYEPKVIGGMSYSGPHGGGDSLSGGVAATPIAV